MKINSRLKTGLAILLVSHSLAASALANPADIPESYSGYSVDGRTSASVLAAKRSHAVSKQDETGLAIYSGLMVIGLIVFFVHALSKKK